MEKTCSLTEQERKDKEIKSVRLWKAKKQAQLQSSNIWLLGVLERAEEMEEGK